MTLSGRKCQPRAIISERFTLEDFSNLTPNDHVAHKFVPCKKITPRQEDRKWITNQVKNSCTKKQAAWIRFASQRTDELYDKFKQQRNKTKQHIRTAKKCYYMKIFSKENDNKKKFTSL